MQFSNPVNEQKANGVCSAGISTEDFQGALFSIARHSIFISNQEPDLKYNNKTEKKKTMYILHKADSEW